MVLALYLQFMNIFHSHGPDKCLLTFSDKLYPFVDTKGETILTPVIELASSRKASYPTVVEISEPNLKPKNLHTTLMIIYEGSKNNNGKPEGLLLHCCVVEIEGQTIIRFAHFLFLLY